MNKPHYSLTLDEFRALAAEGNLIPLFREILADMMKRLCRRSPKSIMGRRPICWRALQAEKTGRDILFWEADLRR